MLYEVITNVYRGNPVDALSFGYGNDTLTIKASEWVDYSFADELTRYNTPEWSNIFHARYKNHTMYITEHISYLTSPTYKISKEITGIQSISGVMTNTTVANFLTNIVKAVITSYSIHYTKLYEVMPTGYQQ